MKTMTDLSYKLTKMKFNNISVIWALFLGNWLYSLIKITFSVAPNTFLSPRISLANLSAQDISDIKFGTLMQKSTLSWHCKVNAKKEARINASKKYVRIC